MLPHIDFPDHLLPHEDMEWDDLVDIHQNEEEPTVAKRGRRPSGGGGTAQQTRTGTSPRRVSTPKETKGLGLGRRPLGIVAYGPSGIGKTSWVGHFPKVGFIYDPQETGVLDLHEYRQIPDPVTAHEADTWKGLLKAVDDAAMGRGQWKGVETVALDSLTGFEKLCFIHHCREQFDGDWSSKGFYSYQQGPKNAAKTDWPDFLDALEEIRNAGRNVILLGHSMVKPFKNPEGPDWDHYRPKLEAEIWDATHRWAQAVFFLNKVVQVDKSGTRNKAKAGTERRVIYTEGEGAYDAKNRMGLPPIIDMGDSGEESFQNFLEAMKGLK